jgi:hypothetical protein
MSVGCLVYAAYNNDFPWRGYITSTFSRVQVTAVTGTRFVCMISIEFPYHNRKDVPGPFRYYTIYLLRESLSIMGNMINMILPFSYVLTCKTVYHAECSRTLITDIYYITTFSIPLCVDLHPTNYKTQYMCVHIIIP